MKKINFKAKRTQDLIFCLLILLIPMIQFAIFYIGVNINSFAMIFQKYEVDATGRGQYVLVDSLFDNVEDLFFQLRFEGVLKPAIKIHSFPLWRFLWWESLFRLSFRFTYLKNSQARGFLRCYYLPRRFCPQW